MYNCVLGFKYLYQEIIKGYTFIKRYTLIASLSILTIPNVIICMFNLIMTGG